VTSGFIFRRRESGWPIPPAAPRTATCLAKDLELEKFLMPEIIIGDDLESITDDIFEVNLIFNFIE